MPFIPHTPEALIARSDSKNPAVTCRGLTSAGRPCRRAISRNPLFSRSEDIVHNLEAYCWQHKDQVAAPRQALPQGRPSVTIRERTSIDTLVDRLGLMDIQDGDEGSKKRISTVPHDLRYSANDSRPPIARFNRKPIDSGHVRRKKATHSSLSLFCCIGVSEDEPNPPRPIRVPAKHSIPVRKSKDSTGQPMQEINPQQSRPRIPSMKPLPTSLIAFSTPISQNSSRTRPSLHHYPSSRTAELLSFIPGTTTPHTTSLLLAELAKPLSIHDEEGYIYIFWLTPTSLPSIPSFETASSLLSPLSSRPAQDRQRTSDILQSFSHTSGQVGKNDKSRSILLKIGRATNVHRRMNEWSRQCGHNLSLVRYYPYCPSTHPGGSPTTNNVSPSYLFDGIMTPTKVAHVHRVERLIHIELADWRAKESGRCTSCGSAHREWFEIDASKEGIRYVDEVVRRWVGWAFMEKSIKP